MKFIEDDRAQRVIDVFDELVGGQINISYVNSTDHVVAWHKHRIQTDYWYCVKGSFKVGIASDERGFIKWEYLSDKNPRVLKIPPGFYHGYKAIEPGSILLYYLSERYDPNDEFRKQPGKFLEDWKTENK